MSAARPGGRPPPAALLIDLDGVLVEAEGGVDDEVLGFVREARAAGRPVALTAGGGDPSGVGAVARRLAAEFDAIVDPVEVGAAKPSREYYIAACAAVGVPPDRCLMLDDNDRDVRGARAAGLSAHRWTGPGDLAYVRAALGLAIVDGVDSDS